MRSAKNALIASKVQPASLGALLAQHNDEGKEVACYYLSRTMVGAE